MSYWTDKGIEDPELARLRQRQNNGAGSNPNLDDFMGTLPGASATGPAGQATGGTDTFLGLASSMRDSAAVQADGSQRQVLEGLISQLNQEAQSGTGGKPAASKFFMRNLPSVQGPTTPCAICVESFSASNSDDPAKKLPCNHIFHKQCLLPWLKLHNTCPFCR
ncbi:hypothetical protein HDU98_008513 [Podochytrium sp. JEL0797]|nr:hypothetical protein HDU98_008513 [Podochytrium sp. JEL0797]